MSGWYEDDEDEILPADDWPTFYTPVPVWIHAHRALTAQAVRMYTFLAEHINQRNPGQRIACPSRKAIARYLGLKDYRDVKRYDEELNEAGALVTTEHRYAGGMRRAYRYRVSFNPPAGYSGWRSLKDFYEANPDVRAKRVEGRTRAALNPATPERPVHNEDVSAGQPGGGFSPTSGGGRFPTSRGGESPTAELNEGQPHPRDPDDAPSARSAGDARRASTGRTARATRGASGAADKSSGTRMDRQTAKAYREVLAALPALLRTTTVGRPLPATIPTNPLGALIREQLRERTAAQLIARVERRWVEHRWSAKLEGREPAEEMLTGVGVAVALLRSPECPDAACEDGTYIDGGPCRTCAEGRQDRARTARSRPAGVPGTRKPSTGRHGAEERPRCVRCREAFPASAGVPEDGVCKPCNDEEQRDAAAAVDAAQQWAAADAALRGEPTSAGAPF